LQSVEQLWWQGFVAEGLTVRAPVRDGIKEIGVCQAGLALVAEGDPRHEVGVIWIGCDLDAAEEAKMAKSHAQMMERAPAAHDQLAILWVDNPASPGAVGAEVKMRVAQTELPLL
jgi:hypothetical protein